MRKFANFYIVLFFIAAITSFLHGTLGIEALGSLKAASIFFLLLLAIPLFFLVGISPGLPARVFVPMFVFLFWLLCNGMPLSFYLDSNIYEICFPLIQAGISIIIFFLIKRHTHGKSWLLIEDFPQLPAANIKRFLIFILTSFIVAPIFIASYFYISASIGIGKFTSEFVRFDYKGIYTQSRVYNKDEKTIHLIGMMHIGDENYYELVKSIIPHNTNIILLEGVTDKDNKLSEGFSYKNFAAAIGMETQDKLQLHFQKLNSRSADIDLREFDPKTIKFMRSLVPILSSKNIKEVIIFFLAPI